MQFVVFIRFLKAFLNEERSKIFFFSVEKIDILSFYRIFLSGQFIAAIVHNEDTFVWNIEKFSNFVLVWTATNDKQILLKRGSKIFKDPSTASVKLKFVFK